MALNSAQEVHSNYIFGEDVAELFQSWAKVKSDQKPCLVFSLSSPSQIPSTFSSLIEECGLVLGKASHHTLVDSCSDALLIQESKMEEAR